jgi:hypothetical protein
METGKCVLVASRDFSVSAFLLVALRIMNSVHIDILASSSGGERKANRNSVLYQRRLMPYAIKKGNLT